MDLWLVRHGEAVPESVDPSRPLSPDGARDLFARAADLVKEMPRCDLVASSPKLRARQTAAILAAAAGIPGEAIVETDALGPSAVPEAFLDFLGNRKERGTAICVGHIPSIAHIASYLLSPAGLVRFAFGPGTACRIRLSSFSRGSGELLLFR